MFNCLGLKILFFDRVVMEWLRVVIVTICAGHGKGEVDAGEVDARKACKLEWRCAKSRLSVDSERGGERDGVIPGDDAEEAATVSKLVDGSNGGVEIGEDVAGTRGAGEGITWHEFGLRSKWVWLGGRVDDRWPGGVSFETRLWVSSNSTCLDK
jgi:hypothetical protein